MQNWMVFSMLLCAKDICKKIRGKTVLSHVNLELESGTIYGFVGRNGSGKTMLFRALSGLISVSSGEVTLDGKVLRKDFSVLPNLGIILETTGLYPNLTGIENLSYLASIQKRIGLEQIKRAIRRVGLDPEDKRTYRKYSMGMKQRLALAQAVMERPDIIMLDEPTNGLDEDGVDMIRKLILAEKERGAMILVASHNKEDIHILADQVYRISAGVVSQREENVQ